MINPMFENNMDKKLNRSKKLQHYNRYKRVCGVDPNRKDPNALIFTKELSKK